MNTANQYVKAIHLLQKMENSPAATGALADVMEVSPASTNEVIGRLESHGLVEHKKYKGITFTDDDIVRARNVLRTYCIIERFLSSVLGVEKFRAETRGPEPAIDGMIAEQLDTITDRNSECPDCFDPKTDACGYLDVRGAEPETETETAN